MTKVLGRRGQIKDPFAIQKKRVKLEEDLEDEEKDKEEKEEAEAEEEVALKTFKINRLPQDIDEDASAPLDKDEAVVGENKMGTDELTVEKEGLNLTRAVQPSLSTNLFGSVGELKSSAKKGRTKLSIALPGSILNNVATLQLKTLLASQISRNCAIFKVEEVIIFDDQDAGDSRVASTDNSCLLLKKFLEFQVTPQYLRKFFFDLDRDLSYASLLRPLATPHHMKEEDFSRFRNGITLNKLSENGFTMANCGLQNDVVLDRKLKADICVTVKFDKSDPYQGKIVSPSEPFVHGYYWGYSVRFVESIEDIFVNPKTNSPYDLTLGTSDSGDYLTSLSIPDAEHVLVVFGGVQGLEFAFKNSKSSKSSAAMSRQKFDFYVNCCPNQGSRTIRTEEALPIVLTCLNDKIHFL